MDTLQSQTTSDLDQATLSIAYDGIAEHTALYPEFYSWVCEHASKIGLPPDTPLLDVGCGTGRMLRELSAHGFQRLAGVDFSERCVSLAKDAVSSAQIWQHNVLSGPMGSFGLIVMTEVIEHVTDPVLSLRNVRASLQDNGWLVITFPNRLAYWPWYHLARFYNSLPRNPRLRHWFSWFTMPYEMRSTQPIDHAYSVAEVRVFLAEAGFSIVSEHGLRLWPMFRISGLDWTERIIGGIERKFGRYLPRWLFYRYMFVCRPA